MTGSVRTVEQDRTWYQLTEVVTDRIVGKIRRNGEVRSDDPAVIERVTGAFGRELFVRDGEVIEELGVCYADVTVLPPDAPAHHELVFRNLALLTGYMPTAS